MPLQQVFSLTPKDSMLDLGVEHNARLDIRGSCQISRFGTDSSRSFNGQYMSDELYFASEMVADETTDFTIERNRQKSPHVCLHYRLSAFEPHKEVALTFRFNSMTTESRVLVYSYAGLLEDQILHADDDQLLIEVESTDSLWLYFIHVNLDGSLFGGDWLFRGIDGYIA